jgi:hypothetical protein
MSEVTLVSTSNRTHVIVLDHAAFRDKKYGFRITSQAVSETSKDGVKSFRTQRRALPGSLTLAPGASISGLHPAIEHCAQVKALRAQGLVKIEHASAE